MAGQKPVAIGNAPSHRCPIQGELPMFHVKHPTSQAEAPQLRAGGRLSCSHGRLATGPPVSRFPSARRVISPPHRPRPRVGGRRARSAERRDGSEPSFLVVKHVEADAGGDADGHSRSRRRHVGTVRHERPPLGCACGNARARGLSVATGTTATYDKHRCSFEALTPPTRMRSCRTPGDRVSSASRSLRVALSRPNITWRRMGTLAGPSVPARTTTPDAPTALHAEQRAYPAGSAVEMRRQIHHARRRDELVPHRSHGRVACSVSVRAQLRQEADRSSARRPGVHSLARKRKPLSQCLRCHEPRDPTTRTTRFT